MTVLRDVGRMLSDSKVEIEFNPNSTVPSSSGKTILAGTGCIKLKGGFVCQYSVYKK
jgi:hypothetical protein